MTTNRVSLTDTPLVLVPQHFGCIVYDRRTCQYLPFDREATGLLRNLSRMSLAEVLAACPDAQERARILAFYDWGSTLGLFTLEGRWAGAVLEITPPVYAEIETTVDRQSLRVVFLGCDSNSLVIDTRARAP